MTPSDPAPEAPEQAWLIGYGTLLSLASLARDIGGEAMSAKTYHPITVFDYKRLFNLRPEHYESSRMLSPRGNEDGAMNVQSSQGDSFNAVMFRVSDDELTRLDERERYYDRILVPVHRFEDGEPCGEAFVYSAAPGSPWVIDDPDRLMPRWLDIEHGRTGSYRISPEFGRMFDRTTYLADGSTRVADRYAEIPQYIDLLLDPERNPSGDVER